MSGSCSIHVCEAVNSDMNDEAAVDIHVPAMAMGHIWKPPSWNTWASSNPAADEQLSTGRPSHPGGGKKSLFVNKLILGREWGQRLL